MKLRGAIAVCAVSAMLVPALVTVGASPASAQEASRKSWSIFDIFRPKPRREIVVPNTPAKTARPQRKTGAAASATPREPKVEIVEKSADARTVLVIGDFLAGGLAEGMIGQFAQDPNIRVTERSKGSSGLVRQDYYNWNAELPALIDAEKPAAVVVMLGSNDRQQIRIDGANEAVRSEKWLKEYQTRAASLADMIEERKIPLLWIGMPSFGMTKMNSDMIALNDVYRNVAQANSGEFIDIWDGFADEQGSYVQTGPDVNGQPVKLRASDGINMTRQGKAKMAFYVEKPLRKLLGLNVPGAALPLESDDEAKPIAPDEIPNRTAPISLMDPELDGATELLGAKPLAPTVPAGDEAQKRQTVQPQALPGRVDDYSWMRRQKQLLPGVQMETTTAIKR